MEALGLHQEPRRRGKTTKTASFGAVTDEVPSSMAVGLQVLSGSVGAEDREIDSIESCIDCGG